MIHFASVQFKHKKKLETFPKNIKIKNGEEYEEGVVNGN